MKFLLKYLLLAAVLYVAGAVYAQPPHLQADLNLSAATTEELNDNSRIVCATDSAAVERRYAYKLNRRRVDGAKAYDDVTLWNVRRIKVKSRHMRLSDTTKREKVQLLKFFVERDRKKGTRPHLLGNVAGCTWSRVEYDSVLHTWRSVPMHIDSYTLRREYDSVRMVGGHVSMFNVPKELWHNLSSETLYILNGEPVPGHVFLFVDGLILRTLEVHTDTETKNRYGTEQSVVTRDIYPDRIPLVLFSGEFSTIESWLRMCRADLFSSPAEVPMHYFYILPVEAVQLYGVQGKYGAICIDIVE